MPSAPKIHKQILSALKQSIIPPLHRQEVALGCVTPPFQFPKEIEARLIKKNIPRKGPFIRGYPIQSYWPKANLLAEVLPYVGFLYQGTAYEHTLVTAKQASKENLSKGIYAIRWQNPSLLCFPPMAPRKAGGDGSFWDGPDPLPEDIKMLWLNITPAEVLIHMHSENGIDPPSASHSIQINDESVVKLSHLFVTEMQEATAQNQDIAQAVLLSLMLRLEHYLQTKPVKLANTSFPHAPSLNPAAANDYPHKAWQEALFFIQLHLHETLTLPLIARHVEFSPSHLNRIFHQYQGTSVMQYVRMQRIAAAKDMLIIIPENISEIARMAGFSNTSVFCNAFRRETGMSPKQFRRQAREKKTHV